MKRIITPVLAVTTLWLGGCLVTSRNSHIIEGPQVSETTLNQIALGETSEQWILATLGAPSSTVEAEENSGNRVLRYSHTETHKSKGSVLFLFHNRSRTTHHETICFEVAGGVVTRYWVENG